MAALGGWASQWTQQRQVPLAWNSYTEPGGAVVDPQPEASASKDKFGRVDDISNVMHIINVRKAAVAWSSLSALGGCCGDAHVRLLAGT